MMPDTQMPSTDCCVCGKHMLVVERQSAHGYFFHGKCFRCCVCSCVLWLSTSSAHKGLGNRGKTLSDVVCVRLSTSSVHKGPGNRGNILSLCNIYLTLT